MVLVLPEISSYSINYYDCLQTKLIKKYEKATICQRNKPEETTSFEYNIVQRKKINKLEGYSCSVKSSTFHFKCGAWSHLKLSTTPAIEHTELVTTEWCKEMINHRRFKTENTLQSFPLEMDQVNVIPVVEVGELTEVNDKVICKGENAHIGNLMHTNVVVLKEYKILIRKEKYMSDGKIIESQSNRIGLPCPVTDRSCSTGDGTFLWDLPENSCGLQLIRKFKPISVMKSYLLDHDLKILVNTTGITRLEGCDVELVKTNYQDLFLVSLDQHMKLAELEPGELDIALEGKVARDYMTYREEVREVESDKDTQELVCQQSHVGPGTTIRIKDNLFGMTRGDLYLVYTCLTKTANILETDNCYDVIPLDTQPIMFVEPSNRILVKHASPVVCNKYFPLTILSDQGWIELNPHFLKVKPPLQGEPSRREIINHEDLSKNGLYTDQEIEAWERLLEFPVYHEAKLKELSWGVCLSTGVCQNAEGVQQYDFQKLMKDEATSWNPISSFMTKIHEYGDILALIVILWLLFKLIIDLTMIAMTLLKEGPGAAAALIMNIYLSTQIQYKKIQKRNKKLRNRINEEEEMQELT